MSSKGIRRHAQNLLIILGSIGNIIFVVFFGGGGEGVGVATWSFYGSDTLTLKNHTGKKGEQKIS